MILTIVSHVFSLKLLCKIDTYNVYHCANIVNKKIKLNHVEHCSTNVLNFGVTFNLLLLFNVCPFNFASNKQLLPELFIPSALPYTKNDYIKTWQKV